jgi:hypothetical protein
MKIEAGGHIERHQFYIHNTEGRIYLPFYSIWRKQFIIAYYTKQSY